MSSSNSEQPGARSGAHSGPSPDEVSPLGLGHAPAKDPMKGFNGMVSGTLILEAISILLALLVVLKLEDGTLWTPFNWGFIVALGIFHVLMPAFVKKRWSLAVIMAVQVIGLVVGFFIHWSLSGIMIIFILVWAFALHLRSSLVERMKRGYLTTQHLEA